MENSEASARKQDTNTGIVGSGLKRRQIQVLQCYTGHMRYGYLVDREVSKVESYTTPLDSSIMFPRIFVIPWATSKCYVHAGCKSSADQVPYGGQ